MSLAVPVAADVAGAAVGEAGAEVAADVLADGVDPAVVAVSGSPQATRAVAAARINAAEAIRE
ncbi:hypothetical protein AB0B85_15120 [Micromonospora sp. NPDC049044]|uniref:hypothetical protein n=1 Tax=Micromonospora sp. NPDC049044 TaxID=3154827 RepID=UPI0034082682